MPPIANQKLNDATALDEAAFMEIIRNGEVLTINEDGISVIRTRSGQYVKIFRLPKLFSSDLYSPRPLRFVNAVKKLQQIGIPTVRNLRLYWIECMHRHAVHYEALEGAELRQRLQDDGDIEPLVKNWIGLLAQLHKHGIYFRGINFSNVLVTREDQLGLIDVGSVEFKTAPLSPELRARNFKHPLAYAADLGICQAFGITAMVEAYLEHANLDTKDRQRFLHKLSSQHPAFTAAVTAIST